MEEFVPKIESTVKEFEEWYDILQDSFQVKTHSMSGLVTAVSNQFQPIHRWYSLKEGFSSELPLWVVDHLAHYYKAEISRVIDPFIGGGTTGVSLALSGISVDGVEYNPFIHLIARAKSDYPRLGRSEVVSAIRKIALEQPDNLIDVPALTTLQNPKYFQPDDVQVMLHTIRQIQESDIDQAIKRLLLLGVAGAAEMVAHLRKDGRALRYEKKPDKPSAQAAIHGNWTRMVDDLEQHRYSGDFNVYQGSAVDLATLIAHEAYDLVLYSPPYLNNFDYSEVYKLELWLLGYVSSVEDWRNLRRSTLRSHPSIQFEDQGIFDTLPKMSSLHSNLKQMCAAKILVGERNEVGKIIVGYFEDMYLAFQEQWRVLKPGGYLVFVVANSRHRYLPIATDVILGEIARLIGFEPLELLILKQRNGRTRQKAYLRESAVILRKPVR